MFEQLIRPDQVGQVLDAMTKPPAKQGRPRANDGNRRYPKVDNPWGLTPVQCKILQLMSEHDMRNVEVAETLHLSPKTISTHMTRAFLKLEVTHITAAALRWDRWARQGQPS